MQKLPRETLSRGYRSDYYIIRASKDENKSQEHLPLILPQTRALPKLLVTISPTAK